MQYRHDAWVVSSVHRRMLDTHVQQVCDEPPSSARNKTPHATAARARAASIDRYQQTSRTLLLPSIDGTDRRTDGRTDGHPTIT